MSGILHCKHHVKWTEILCVKDGNCLHYQRWVCTGESTALTQSLVLWDVFKVKLHVSKNPVVTKRLFPHHPVLGLLGSAHGLVPDQSTAGVTCSPQLLHGHTWALTSRDAERCICFQLITSTYRHSQVVTQTLLYCSLQVFSSSSSVLKIRLYFFSVLF